MAEKITALSKRQELIKRLNLWFGRELGDSDYPYSTQKTVAVREIIDNSIDAIRKKKKEGTIKLTFFEDGSIECYDSGGGIPTDISETADGKKASSVYLALGVMGAGSNYENVTDSLGTFGVGGSCTTLLSEYSKVEVYRDKKKYRLDFSHGEPGIFENEKFKSTKDLTFLKTEKDDRAPDEKKKFPSGTKIYFKLDDKNFKSKYPVNYDDLIERMRGVAFLTPLITFEITNYHKKLEDGSPQVEIFNFQDGIKQMVELSTNDRLTDIHVIKNIGEFTDSTVDISNKNAEIKNIQKTISVEVAFAYCNNFEYKLDSYVNTIKTRLHGFHVQAFEKALVSVFNKKFRAMKSGLSKNDEDTNIQDFQEGLSAVVSINIPEPEFTNQIKEEYGGKNSLKEFTKLISEALENWLNSSKNQNDLKVIAEKVILASKNRLRAKEAQDLKRKKAKLAKTTTMPTKLVDCEITNDKDSELFIVEGDSALGGLKAARDSKFQALIPIRGKIINVLKSPMKKVISNQEVQDLIKCLDAGVGEDFVMENSRYGRVIIATDADPDGGAISTLLLVLFWKLFPELVTSGNLYKACTPLFIVSEKNNRHYCYNVQEYDQLTKKLDSKKVKYSVVRAKGLGETGSDVLFETGMNPETRRLERIVEQDIKHAEKWLDIAMGQDVEQRREWIESTPLDIREIED